MERNLFATGAMAALHHEEWKIFGHRRFQSSFVLAKSSKSNIANNKNKSDFNDNPQRNEHEDNDDFDSDEENGDDDDYENRRGRGNRGNVPSKRRRVH